MQQIQSAHVVRVLEYGIAEVDVPFIVMDRLVGEDLSTRLRGRGPLPVAEVVHVVEGIGAALTAAHELGIVHRDIKPANVFLCAASPRPLVKLVDFGIAKRLEDDSLTTTGAFVGTPLYMSPEQLDDSRRVDHRADLWALGVVTYLALTGAPPFRGEDLIATLHAIARAPTPRVSILRPDLPGAIDTWLAQALAKEPAGRFASATEMVAALKSALDDVGAVPRPRIIPGDDPTDVLPDPAARVPPRTRAPTSWTAAAAGAVDPGGTPEPVTRSPRARPLPRAFLGVAIGVAVAGAFALGRLGTSPVGTEASAAFRQKAPETAPTPSAPVSTEGVEPPPPTTAAELDRLPAGPSTAVRPPLSKSPSHRRARGPAARTTDDDIGF
jgi:serine/threonine-protein kinase